MADNYLERRMEDYRAGKLAPRQHSASGSGTVSGHKIPGAFTLVFPPQSVVVIGGETGLLSELVRSLRSVDSKVAFLQRSSKELTTLAQSTGSRYYPFDPTDTEKVEKAIDDLTDRWDRVDVVIDLREADVAASGIDGSESDSIDDATLAVAKLLTLHTHPSFGGITSLTYTNDTH